MSERELKRRLDSGILDMRILLRSQRLQGEQRRAAEEELLALRLARAGVHTKGQVGYLARHGVHRRPPLLHHGPVARWPGHRVRIVA